MSRTAALFDWLEETSRRRGISVERIVREQLENAKAEGGKRRFLCHAGAITGEQREVSSRKGFSRT